MKLSKIELITILSAIKHGFTFSNDSFFKSYTHGKRTISSLTKKGLLAENTTEFGVEYNPTIDAVQLYGAKR